MDKSKVRDFLNEKFGDINFIEESHQYFIDEREYTPVSHIIKEYEIPVDWDEKALNYALKHGRLKEDVQREWKLNNLKSTISGTRTHEFGESYTNLMCGHPELICEGNKKQYVDEYGVLLPTYPKEESVVKFYNEINLGSSEILTPIGAEFRLSTKYIDGARPICGTCDILFWKEDLIYPENSGYVLGDWKTNKSLFNDYNRRFGVYMKPPFNAWIDESYNHYTLQFNLYQKMLESVGVKVIDRILIWLKDDGYEIFHIEKIDDKVLNQVIKK